MNKYQIYWYMYKNKTTNKKTNRKKHVETNRHKSMFISSLCCMAM